MRQLIEKANRLLLIYFATRITVLFTFVTLLSSCSESRPDPDEQVRLPSATHAPIAFLEMNKCLEISVLPDNSFVISKSTIESGKLVPILKQHANRVQNGVVIRAGRNTEVSNIGNVLNAISEAEISERIWFAVKDELETERYFAYSLPLMDSFERSPWYKIAVTASLLPAADRFETVLSHPSAPGIGLLSVELGPETARCYGAMHESLAELGNEIGKQRSKFKIFAVACYPSGGVQYSRFIELLDICALAGVTNIVLMNSSP